MGVTGEISVVISTAEYASCKVCKSKVVSEENVAECSKCSVVMKLSLCSQSKSAKFIVMMFSGRDFTLFAFEPILSQIVDGVSGDSLSVKLLNSPCKSYWYNDRHVIFSVQGN